MSTTRTGVIPLVGPLLVSAVAPAAVTARTEASLSVDVTQDEAGAVAITVADNGTAVGSATYTDTGGSETDANRTLTLDNPEETVEPTITATEANDTASTTVDLDLPEPIGPFGRVVSALVDAPKRAGFTGVGSRVSDSVTSNNPSNAGNSEAVTSPEAGNNAPITPPGQEQRNDSRVVPAGPPVENPGGSGSAPGQSDDGDDGSEEGEKAEESGEADESDERAESEDSDGSGGNGDDDSGSNAGGNGR
jgi:hypothetical protein